MIIIMQEFGRIVSDSVHLKNENNIIESSTISLTKNNPGTENYYTFDSFGSALYQGNTD
mgnify:CR=1 FL=1